MPRYPVRPVDPEFTAPGGVAAVDRALCLMNAYRDGERALSLSEFCERTQLVPSTALRLIASLLHFGYLQRLADGRYALGASVARLHRIYADAFDLEAIVLPALQKLASVTRESASFHVREGNQRLVLYRVNSPQEISAQVREGDLLPLDKGTGGHVLVAFTGVKGKLYDKIRKEGFMASPISDRSSELAGISAPVFDAGNQIAGAVTLTMPAQRYDAAHIVQVKAAASQLTRLLGGTT